ncbi:hypothetical protein N7533_007043 [Penicillium manginii]|uniref:uncharacterized protein n=1 Tax=Penicillium manginii TaxID=203109 RepID=UPI002546DCE2|nr:uncharacterized protein N7533_007043 [Penicillium manginii]KAJ5750015.1 hypothetical protein N7533_007043 [Penicillium manginii]
MVNCCGLSSQNRIKGFWLIIHHLEAGCFAIAVDLHMLPYPSGISSLAAAIPLRRHDNQPEGRKAHRFIPSSALRTITFCDPRFQGFDFSLALALTKSTSSSAGLPAPRPRLRANTS